jgi:predicted methyltransferase
VQPFDDPVPADMHDFDLITFLFFYHDMLRREVEAAGFKLVAEGDFWRHPEDTRDSSIQPPRNRPVDEFVLKFQKPM